MAKTPWWYCNACGFKNHPRDQRVYPGTPEINKHCEQCGAEQTAGVDFHPAGAGGT